MPLHSRVRQRCHYAGNCFADPRHLLLVFNDPFCLAVHLHGLACQGVHAHGWCQQPSGLRPGCSAGFAAVHDCSVILRQATTDGVKTAVLPCCRWLITSMQRLWQAPSPPSRMLWTTSPGRSSIGELQGCCWHFCHFAGRSAGNCCMHCIDSWECSAAVWRVEDSSAHRSLC